MIVGYVKKEKDVSKIRELLGIIKVHQCEQGYVINLPNINNEKRKNRLIQKILQKIIKFKINILVFSKELEGEKNKVDEILKEENRQATITTGKKIMEYMKLDILEYIFKTQNKDMKAQDIYLMINKQDVDIGFLSDFIENFKTVNIITKDVEKFKKIQQDLYENDNILISVSNNKRKALKKARYIMNFNFDKNELEKYTINRDAIIINIKNKIRYNTSTFNGININNIKIEIPDEILEKYENITQGSCFEIIEIYESLLYNELTKNNEKYIIKNNECILKFDPRIIKSYIKKDGVKILGLVGNNGEISRNELLINSIIK